MRNKTGKLFQNIQTRKVSAYEYIKKNEYFAFVEMIQKQGNNQCIFTSDIMLLELIGLFSLSIRFFGSAIRRPYKYTVFSLAIISASFLIDCKDLQDRSVH